MTDDVMASAGELLLVRGEGAAVEGWFADLYEQSFPRVYAFVYAQVGDPGWASEIVGRVFLRAYKAREKAPAGGEALFWLFRIARTTLLDFWRVDGRWRQASAPLEAGRELAASGKSPEAVLLERERVVMLARAMESLAERDRTLLALKFAAKQTNRGIAGILGISEAAVSMRLMRALRRLRVELDERGLTL